MFSYARRLYAGNSATRSGGGLVYIVKPYVWGMLESLTIDVLRPYAANGPLSVHITAPGFDDHLMPHDFSQAIDLMTAGKRVITRDGVIGAAASDGLARYAGWLSGDVTVALSRDTDPVLSKAPLFEIEIVTDQGITASDLIQVLGPADDHPRLIGDSTTPAL